MFSHPISAIIRVHRRHINLKPTKSTKTLENRPEHYLEDRARKPKKARLEMLEMARNDSKDLKGPKLEWLEKAWLERLDNA